MERDSLPGAPPPYPRPTPSSAEPYLQRGWYPDPEVEALQFRWWDGRQWAQQIYRNKNYPLTKRVRNGRGRFWNRLIMVLALSPVYFGAALLNQHLFLSRAGDPTSVNVADLGIQENPKIVIAAQCRGSVRTVDRYQGYVNWPNQMWSVDPTPGHVAVAYFNVNTGQVTCP